MKKLLALVLCVVMVMSLAPTAFAGNTEETTSGTNPLYFSNTYDLTTAASKANANKAISHAKSNIEYLYGALAADKAIFETIKGMDTMIGDLTTEMFKGAKDLPMITASALKDNTKLYLKDYIGSEIVRYMNNHHSDYASESVKRTTGANTLGLTYIGRVQNSATGLFADVFAGANGVAFAATEVTPGSGVYNWQKTTPRTAITTASDLNNYTWTNANSEVTGTPGAYSQVLSANTGLTYTGRMNPNGAFLYTDKNGVVYAASKNGFDADGHQIYNWQVTNGTLAQALNGTAAWSNATVRENTKTTIDPIDYAVTYYKALNSAFNDEKSAANLQNIMYQMYTYKVWSDIDDKLDDLFDDIKTWENGTNILNQYHFREGLDPYIFLNDNAQDLPETVGERLPATIWAP